MSDYPMVAGVDPGFANFGVAVVELRPQGERIVRIEVLRTKSMVRRRHLLAADDDSRRISWLGNQFDWICNYYSIMAVLAEEKRRLPNSGSAAKLAMGWSVAVLVATMRGLPFRQVTPGEIKLATAESERASKAQVEAAIRHRYPDSDAIKAFDQAMWDKTKKRLMNHREHGFDALGAVIAALNSDIIGALRPR